MNSYRVQFTSAAAKELRKLDQGLRRRLLASIAERERDPRPSGCRKLAGETHAWRIRVGDYRVLYEITDNILVVTVIRVAHEHAVLRRCR